LDQAVLKKLFKALMELLFLVRAPSLYKSLRDLAIDVLQKAHGSEEKEYRLNVDTRYEASLWVDGISNDTLDAFHTNMLKASRSTVPAYLQIAKAWKTAGFVWPFPRCSISTTLLQAIQDLQKSKGPFAALVSQITLRMMFRSESPLVLAALVVASTVQDEEAKPAVQALREYCSSIVKFDPSGGADRSNRLSLALETVFPDGFVLNHVIGLAKGKASVSTTKPFYSDQAWEILHALIHCIQGLEKSQSDRCKDTAYRILPLCAMATEQCATGASWEIIRSVLGQERSDYVDLLLLLSRQSRQQRTDFMSGPQNNNDLLLYLMSDFLPAEDALELSVSLLKRFAAGANESQQGTSGTLLLVHCLRTLRQQNFGENVLPSTRIQTFIALAISVWTEILSDTATSQDRLLVQTIESVVAHVLNVVESGYIGILSVNAEATVQKCLSSTRYKLTPDSDCLLSTLLRLDEVAFRSEFLKAHNSLVGTQWYDSLIVDGKLDRVLNVLAEASGLVPDSLLGLIDKRCSSLAGRLRKGDVQLPLELIPLLLKFKSFFAETILPIDGVNTFIQEFIKSSETRESDEAFELAALLCSKEIPIDSMSNDSTRRLASLLLKALCTTLRSRLRRIPRQSAMDAVTLSAECASATRHLRDTFAKCKRFDDDALEDATFIIDTIKSCLRFSVNACADGLEGLRIDILELTYEVLVAFGNRMHFGRMAQGSVSSIVFELVSRHSQFTNVCEAQEQARFQYAVFSILQLCLEMNTSISFEASTWKIFSKAFCASPSQKDVLVLRVIETYAKRAKDVSALLSCITWLLTSSAVSKPVTLSDEQFPYASVRNS
jgi:hypothetical protein